MTGMNPTRTRRLIVHGKVQGVWYRGWTVETATGMGLSGWVRNRTDGTVEMILHGPPEAVERMQNACREGPPLALVTKVESRSVNPPSPPLDGFLQRPTH